MPILVSATVQIASSTAATSATAAGLGSVRGLNGVDAVHRAGVQELVPDGPLAE
jgi:hypothetical protein